MNIKEVTHRLKQFNWLTFFALLCVAISSAFIMFMAVKLTNTLSSPDWCARAINAEKLSGTRDSSSCVDLLTIQVKSLAIDNHIYAVTIAVCLAVLVVVVLAKARLDLEATKSGLKTSIGHDGRPAAQAAERVALAAEEEAEAVKEEITGVHDGPAMPEPK